VGKELRDQVREVGLADALGEILEADAEERAVGGDGHGKREDDFLWYGDFVGGRLMYYTEEELELKLV